MIRPLLAALVGLAMAAPAHADERSDLIARYVAWRGGAAFEHLTSVHQAGHIDIAGLSGTAELWQDPSRLRSDADLGVIKTAEAVSPADSWELSQSGVVLNASEAKVREAGRQALLLFGGALAGRGGSHAVLRAPETRDGRTWSVLRIDFGDEDTYDLLLDPASGELHGVEVFENRRHRFQGFDDWRRVDGVMMPFIERTESPLAGDNAVIHWTTVELNRPIDPGRFARPAPSRTFSFEGGKTSTAWIDFEFFAGNRIYFPARINGHDTVVLLDSGAETTVLDKGFADSIGLKSQGGISAIGTGGTDTAGLVGGVALKIGDLSLNNLTVATLDMASIGKLIGHPLPVVLGNEVFNELIVDIDFAHRRIAFRDPGAFTPPAGAVQVPARLVDGLRAVPVSVEGRAPIPFDFDLGDGSPALVFPAYWEKEKLLDGRAQSKALGGAIGGVHPETVATLKTLTFAGTTFANVPTVFTPRGTSAVDTTHTLGNLGLPILSRFHLMTDYPHDRIWLIPDPAEVGAAFGRDRLGVAFSRAGPDFLVDYVSPAGPGEAAGFKAGDHIRLIDRKPPEGWSDEALRSVHGGAAGTVFEFTMADGVVRRVKLQNYY